MLQFLQNVQSDLDKKIESNKQRLGIGEKNCLVMQRLMPRLKSRLKGQGSKSSFSVRVQRLISKVKGLGST